jgi:hypothetical protein
VGKARRRGFTSRKQIQVGFWRGAPREALEKELRVNWVHSSLPSAYYQFDGFTLSNNNSKKKP